MVPYLTKLAVHLFICTYALQCLLLYSLCVVSYASPDITSLVNATDNTEVDGHGNFIPQHCFGYPRIATAICRYVQNREETMLILLQGQWPTTLPEISQDIHRYLSVCAEEGGNRAHPITRTVTHNIAVDIPGYPPLSFGMCRRGRNPCSSYYKGSDTQHCGGYPRISTVIFLYVQKREETMIILLQGQWVHRTHWKLCTWFSKLKWLLLRTATLDQQQCPQLFQ